MGGGYLQDRAGFSKIVIAILQGIVQDLPPAERDDRVLQIKFTSIHLFSTGSPVLKTDLPRDSEIPGNPDIKKETNRFFYPVFAIPIVIATPSTSHSFTDV